MISFTTSRLLGVFTLLACGSAAAASSGSQFEKLQLRLARDQAGAQQQATPVSQSLSPSLLLAQADTAPTLVSSPSLSGNAAVASRLGAHPAQEDDEILRMLREADAVFAGTAITLPDTIAFSDGPLVPAVSLEEVLARTLQNSYTYAASAARAEGATYARNASLGQLGPSLDLRGQRGREYSAPASFVDQNTGRAAASDTHTRWDTSAILRQPLFNPGSYFDYRRTASLADAADLRHEDAREGLYYQAVKAYYDLMRAYAAVTFANKYAERMAGLQEYMNKRVQGGGASRVDFERVRGRALSAKSAVIEAEGALESALVTLTQLTGVRAQQLNIPYKMMPAVPASSRVAMERIFETNPAVRAAREEATAANQELKAARSRFSPTFSFEVSQLRTSNAGGGEVLTTDRRYMLVMNMNLLNGGSDYYYQKEVGTRFVDKSNTASDVERKLREQIQINYRTLDAVKKRIGVARLAYETNSGVADIFLDQLTTGSKQLLDVLDAYQQAYQSQVDLVQLLFLQADISYQILRNTGRASSFFEEQQVR